MKNQRLRGNKKINRKNEKEGKKKKKVTNKLLYQIRMKYICNCRLRIIKDNDYKIINYYLM